jgi:hypothetical protein
MKNSGCREVRDQLVEFVEGELDKTRRALLARHLETCVECQKELKEIEHLRNALTRAQVPEPGAAFWENFPDRVLRAYQSEQAPVTAHQPGSRVQGLLESLRHVLAPPLLIPALALSLVIGFALFFTLEAPVTPGIATLQAKIQTSENLAQLTHRSVAELPADSQFGFSAAPSVSFFRVGHWYAESLAYAAGNETATARTRLVAIAAQLGNAPASLNALTHDNPSRARIAALEPELAQLAKTPRDTALFRAGGQLVNLLLAAAVHDQALLRGAAPEILRLQQALGPLGMAPGVVRNLNALSDLLAGNALADRDYDQIIKLIRDTQLILM